MKTKITFSVLVTAFILTVMAWNHNVQPVPSGIDLSKIIVGKTTIREAQAILGSVSTAHDCKGSYLYRYIPAESAFYGREIEISIVYHGPNTGDPIPMAALVPDGESIVRQIDIAVYPRFNEGSDNYAESLIAKVLDFEYGMFHK